MYHFDDIPLTADCKLEFYDKSGKTIIAFWFNVDFIDGKKLVLHKIEMDKVSKDCKTHKLYPPEFALELNFKEPSVSDPNAVIALAKAKADPRSALTKRTQSLFGEQHFSATEETIDDQSEVVLNSKIWPEEKSSRSACEIASELLIELLSICYDNSPSGIISENNLAIVKAITKLPRFNFFTLATSELQKVDPSELPYKERLAFWLNVYNLLCLHGHIKFLPTTQSKEKDRRFHVYKGAIYQIGTEQYNLLDIEHAVLRSFSERPIAGYPLPHPKFKNKDLRSNAALTKPEVRISFAIVPGTRSAPLIAIYQPETVLEQLEKAEQTFLEVSVAIVASKKTFKVSLPKIVAWYQKDFAKKEDQLVKAVTESLTKEKKEKIGQAKNISVQFDEYDWGFYYPIYPLREQLVSANVLAIDDEDPDDFDDEEEEEEEHKDKDKDYK